MKNARIRYIASRYQSHHRVATMYRDLIETRFHQSSIEDADIVILHNEPHDRESLRDIEACLGAIGPKLYHLGIGAAVTRSTLADANESRAWRIFADFAQVLIRTAIKLHANDATGIADVSDLYALDSTTIDLCLALFPWARFRKHKAAVKMHTLLDLHGSIPPSFTSPTARCMTSMCSTKSLSRPVPSM